MARSAPRKLGAKRMWIRRWLQAGRVSKTEADRFTKHLDRTGILLKPPTAAPSQQRMARRSTASVLQPGSVVTIQYDPTRFRAEFSAIRRGRPRTAKA